MNFGKILFACAVGAAVAHAAPAPMVFLHGIKGSLLDNDQGERGWLNAAQAAGLRTPDLALPTEWEGDTQKTDRWKPVGVLKTLPFIGSFLKKEIYGIFCDALEHSGRPFRYFVYDWRRDLNETSAQLEKFLETVKTENGSVAPTVVGHSMGGMLTLAVLRRRPDLFSAVALVGAPIRGGIGFLPDLHEGVRNGLNAGILSVEKMATFPSVYAFLPLDSERLVRDERGGSLRTNFYRIDTWRGMGLGLYAENRERPKGWDAFFEKALLQAQTFRKGMLEGPPTTVPVLVVRSERHRTLAAMRRDSGRKLHWNFTAEPLEDGDGRVLAQDALPPANLGEFRVVGTEAEHEALLDDPAVQKVIFALP